MEKKNGIVEEIKYAKNQFLQSKQYKNQVDVLNCVLKDDESYSIAQVEILLDEFMKGKVN